MRAIYIYNIYIFFFIIYIIYNMFFKYVSVSEFELFQTCLDHNPKVTKKNQKHFNGRRGSFFFEPVDTSTSWLLWVGCSSAA